MGSLFCVVVAQKLMLDGILGSSKLSHDLFIILWMASAAFLSEYSFAYLDKKKKGNYSTVLENESTLEAFSVLFV